METEVSTTLQDTARLMVAMVIHTISYVLIFGLPLTVFILNGGK